MSRPPENSSTTAEVNPLMHTQSSNQDVLMRIAEEDVNMNMTRRSDIREGVNDTINIRQHLATDTSLHNHTNNVNQLRASGRSVPSAASPVAESRLVRNGGF